MFKKAGDNVHYMDRTGSHSTKGSRRGYTWLDDVSSDNFYSAKNILDRKDRVKLLKKQLSSAWAARSEISPVLRDCLLNHDGETRRAILPTFKILVKNIKLIEAEIVELRKYIPREIKIRTANALANAMRREKRIFVGRGRRRLTKQNITDKA